MSPSTLTLPEIENVEVSILRFPYKVRFPSSPVAFDAVRVTSPVPISSLSLEHQGKPPQGSEELTVDSVVEVDVDIGVELDEVVEELLEVDVGFEVEVELDE
jgi:hypothetical protein